MTLRTGLTKPEWDTPPDGDFARYIELLGRSAETTLVLGAAELPGPRQSAWHKRNCDGNGIRCRTWTFRCDTSRPSGWKKSSPSSRLVAASFGGPAIRRAKSRSTSAIDLGAFGAYRARPSLGLDGAAGSGVFCMGLGLLDSVAGPGSSLVVARSRAASSAGACLRYRRSRKAGHCCIEFRTAKVGATTQLERT